MDFRRRILFIVILPLLLLGVLGLLYLWAEFMIETANRNHALARRLTAQILKVNFITDRYLLYHGSAEEWLTQHAELERFLKTVRGEDREEEELLRQITANTEKIRNLLQRVFELEGADDPRSSQLRQRLVESTMLKSRAAYSDAIRLETGSETRMSELRRRTLQIAFGVSVLMTVGAMLVALRLTRRVVTVVKALTEGTSRIAAGDYDTRVQAEGGDELATLAMAFNGMSEKLRKSALYMETSMKALEVENRICREAEETLKSENHSRLEAEEALRTLNAELERRIDSRTEELRKTTALLEKMKEHAERDSYVARLQAEVLREHHLKLERLIRETRRIFSCTSVENVVNDIAGIGREIANARYCVIGHLFPHSGLSTIAASRAPGAPPCPDLQLGPGMEVVYRDVMARGVVLRIGAADLEKHPHWKGLPEGHVPLRGLLAVPVIGCGDVIGIMMATDRLDGGDFDEEDELIFSQLAALASMAVQCVVLNEKPAAGINPPAAPS
ncbi:MAG TPA: HAMP domain-containing protein [Verrucomicrobiae bacterium]|nr:HAMP domain-containing protein [Verrucomicrobiae bacterium]